MLSQVLKGGHNNVKGRGGGVLGQARGEKNRGKGIPDLGSRTTGSMRPQNTRIRGKHIELKLHQIKSKQHFFTEQNPEGPKDFMNQ